MKLDDQIRYLLKLGNSAELYDATDWLNRNFPWAQHESVEEAKALHGDDVLDPRP